MVNRLAAESSPYLRQHAANPVDWYAWGDEALARARALDRPILLSVGYSACHWCHVMAHESFADEEVARLMNERFVCVKVDREELPDVDAIYQQALQVMGQGGGWPLTMFLTPDLEPFFGGTYFPPVEGYGRPSFRRVVLALGEAWRKERVTVTRDAAAVRSALQRVARRFRGDAGASGAGDGDDDGDGDAGDGASGAGDGPSEVLPRDGVERAALRLAAQLDLRQGGFGGAPKFPHAQGLELLLRAARRLRAAGDAQAESLAGGVRLTLERMAAGGLHDHVGGGFARYSTDAEWLVPHFEKMTYDNAQAVRLYVDAALALDEPRFVEVARATAAWLVRDMQDAAGGFYTALDADADGVEGRYYVWTPAELEAAVGPAAAAVVARCYDVTPAGNWHDPIGHAPVGASVLHRVAEPRDAAERALLEAAMSTLLQARQRRVPPLCDDKVLAGVNGLCVGALAEAGRVFRDPALIAAARRAAAFVLERMTDPTGRLLRTWHGGTARLPGTLEDHAFVADGLITLYEATGEARWLTAARRLTERCLELFYDAASRTFFLTATGDGHLIERPVATLDGPQPSGMGAATRCLVRLAEVTGAPRFGEVARAVAGAHAGAALASPLAYASFLCALDQLQGGVTTIVLAGDDVAALERALAGLALPSRLIVRAAGAPGELAALCAGKGAIAGRAAAWVCTGATCLPPVTEPERLVELLRGDVAVSGVRRPAA